MTINEMRERIAAVYSGHKWKVKVQRMDEGQVIAVFNDFLARGKFDRPANQKVPQRPPKKEKPRARTPYEQYSGKQISIFDETGRWSDEKEKPH